MKHIIGVVLIALITLSGCGDSEKCVKMAAENTELKELANSKAKEIEAITNTLNEVEANIASIELAEQQIDSINAATGGKPSEDQKVRIELRVTAIRNYLENNKLALEKLQAQLARSQNQDKLRGLQAMLSKMKADAEVKETEIVGLKTAIDSLNKKVTDLDQSLAATSGELNKNVLELEERKKDLEAKEALLNAVYVYVGDKKDLVANGITKREGGVFGFGKKSILNDKLETAKFKKVSLKDTKDLELGDVNKTEFLTKHPTDSYTLLMVEQKVVLRITNPEKFWSLSKYLVIEID
jgi:DNA repair exonuclease SbcCD ATPase subunit